MHQHIFMPKSIMDWISNITMIYPEFIPHRFKPRLIPPSWALTNELIFYLLISLGISKTKKRTFYWLLFSIAYYIGTYLFYNIETYRYSAILASSLPFAIGALLYWYKDRLTFKSSFLVVGMLYCMFLLNGVLSSYYNSIFQEISGYINMLLAVLLISQLYKINIKKKQLKKIDNYIGLYSYPIYLAHFIVGIYYIKFIGIGSVPFSFKIESEGLILYFILLFLFCFLIVHLIDLPINKYRNALKLKSNFK